jgi:V/A-type H+/Na+-transporting ATPase subunit K
MNWGDFGSMVVMPLAAIGSALGAGTAGMAAIGAWKKLLAQNKPAAFLLVAFVGAPLTQTIYGLILMNTLLGSGASEMAKLGAGLIGGIALGVSAWYQGKAGASASDAQGETGKGFANFIMVLGLVESVAIFVMVFTLTFIGQAT